jgi:hypothetical protein
MKPRLTSMTSASVDPATPFELAAPMNTGRVVAVGRVVLAALVTGTGCGVTVTVIVRHLVDVGIIMGIDVVTTKALVITVVVGLLIIIIDEVFVEVVTIFCMLVTLDLVDVVMALVDEVIDLDMVEDLVDMVMLFVDEELMAFMTTGGLYLPSSFRLKCWVGFLMEVVAAFITIMADADEALLDEVIVALLEIMLELILLGMLIIVDMVFGGAIPAVTVIVIVQEAEATTFMTGATILHVDSGGGAAIFEDIICALASVAAASAVAVILTILSWKGYVAE